MASRDFKFPGGDKLRHIGASWFVSYMYDLNFKTKHFNWKNVLTIKTREHYLLNSTKFHRRWLQEISKMDPKLLNRNRIGMLPVDTINYAQALFSKKTLLP